MLEEKILSEASTSNQATTLYAPAQSPSNHVQTAGSMLLEAMPTHGAMCGSPPIIDVGAGGHHFMTAAPAQVPLYFVGHHLQQQQQNQQNLVHQHQQQHASPVKIQTSPYLSGDFNHIIQQQPQMPPSIKSNNNNTLSYTSSNAVGKNSNLHHVNFNLANNTTAITSTTTFGGNPYLYDGDDDNDLDQTVNIQQTPTCIVTPATLNVFNKFANSYLD